MLRNQFYGDEIDFAHLAGGLGNSTKIGPDQLWSPISRIIEYSNNKFQSWQNSLFEIEREIGQPNRDS